MVTPGTGADRTFEPLSAQDWRLVIMHDVMEIAEISQRTRDMLRAFASAESDDRQSAVAVEFRMERSAVERALMRARGDIHNALDVSGNKGFLESDEYDLRPLEPSRHPPILAEAMAVLRLSEDERRVMHAIVGLDRSGAKKPEVVMRDILGRRAERASPGIWDALRTFHAVLKERGYAFSLPSGSLFAVSAIEPKPEEPMTDDELERMRSFFAGIDFTSMEREVLALQRGLKGETCSFGEIGRRLGCDHEAVIGFSRSAHQKIILAAEASDYDWRKMLKELSTRPGEMVM